MKLILSMLFVLGLVVQPVLAYDEAKAKHYENLFSTFADKNTPKALSRIAADKLVEMLKAGENIVLLDVRTPVEVELLPVGGPGTLVMQMSEVFKPDNLAKIPTDKKVVAVCQAGLRCTLIAVALRDAGFDNVYSLKGGLIALINYLNAKAAYEKLKAE